MAAAHNVPLEDAQESHVVVVMIIGVAATTIIAVGGGSITGTAAQGWVLSVVSPPPPAYRGGSRCGIILISPTRTVLLVVLLCPAPVGGLSCCGCHGSCSSCSCAAAAATTVISPSISIAEYVVMWGCCLLLLTTISMPPSLHHPFPPPLPVHSVGNRDNNVGQCNIVSVGGHDVDIHCKCAWPRTMTDGNAAKRRRATTTAMIIVVIDDAKAWAMGIFGSYRTFSFSLCCQPSKPPEMVLLLQATTSPSLLCSIGPALHPRPLSKHELYCWLYLFGTCSAPAGQGFNQRPQHPSKLFALMAAEIESLVAGFCLARQEEEGHHIGTVIDLILLLFWRHGEVLASEREKMGHMNNAPQGYRNNRD